MSTDKILELGRCYLVTLELDQIFRAVGDKHIALVVFTSNIAYENL